ncbi:MAG: M3 family metallopeptidase [Gammaproteobacteria bacterium]
MDNPLIGYRGLPPFEAIRPAHAEPALDKVLAENRAAIGALLTEDCNHPTWEHTLRPIEEINDNLNRSWSPIGHLHSVADNDELRKVYETCLPKLTAYLTEMGQNGALYAACKSVAQSAEYAQLGIAERKIIDNALRDFRLSGIELGAQGKERFKALKQRLSRLQTQFEENLLDATDGWNKRVDDERLLAGLPDSARKLAAHKAQQQGQQGWLLTLEAPSYLPVLMYADDRELRFEVYQAYVTRASEQGPNAGRWENTEVMSEILTLRQELARLVGFHDFAQYSLETKMASSAEQVLEFISDLARCCKPIAVREFGELERYAREHLGLSCLEAWDVAYCSEKLKQERFQISQEELRPYFPVPRVLLGLFEAVRQLYGLMIQEIPGVSIWHPDVRFFQIQDESGEIRGQFYIDLYARAKKRGGAWMDQCLARRRGHDELQIPVAYLNCNFSPPLGQDPALLTHDEVITLFHEFGHGLHHMLTRVDYPSVAGINGVAWDAVELPSQFMENFCWEPGVLGLISGHYLNGERLPEALLQRLRVAKNFQAGIKMVRQLEFALFDMRLHMGEEAMDGKAIQALLDQVRKEVAVVPVPSFNRFQNGFSHIFAGGYAAGYYSYKWAEVLSADVFSRFEEKGVLDRTIGEEFLSSILEPGGTREPMEQFIEFRGREPSVEPLLRHTGMLVETH